ncbi:MAG: hypothetical protein Tsb0021_09820 [Chlamydiales bacterium]
MIAILLLLSGLILIFLEFYLPGGIMGVAGAIMIASAVIIVALQWQSWFAIILFLIATAVGLYVVIKVALWHIKRTGAKGSIYLNTDQSGYRASSFDTSLIGKQGEALSDMRPGGRINIEGKKYQALSISGYIPKGSRLTVTGGEGESLFVKIDKQG